MAWSGALMAVPAMASTIAGIAGNEREIEEARKARERAVRIAEGLGPLDLPDGSYAGIDYAGDYDPYLLGAPQSAKYQTTAEDPAARNMQMKALQYLVDQGNGAYDAQNQAEQFHAMDAAAQQANAREGAIRQEMERKGQGGAGISALMRAQAAQQAANRAQSGTLDATAKAALQKLAAQGQALQGAGSVRGQDAAERSRVDEIVNRFNMFNTQAMNHAREQDVAAQNAAGMRNINTRQEINGRNPGIRNSDLDRRTSNAQAKYGAQVGKANMMMGGYNNFASGAERAGSAYNSMGQQGAKLFTDIGKGIANESALSGSREPDNEYTSEDGSFHSRWA